MANPFASERLQLRAFEPNDLPALHAYLNYPELAGRRYVSWRFPSETPISKSQVEDALKSWSGGEKELHLAVTLQEDGTLIGHASYDWGWDALCPEVEIVISPAYQYQGYGSEVLNLLLDYLFNYTPAHNISGGIASWNAEAQQFAQKHGFVPCGRLRRMGMRQRDFYDWLGFELLRPAWLDRSQVGGARWPWKEH